MQTLYNAIAEFAPGRVLMNEPMCRHTTFRVGGPADVMFFPQSAEELQRAMALARAQGAGALVIGNGSNLVVRDGGVRGLVIVLGEHMARIGVEGACLRAQAGAMLARVSAAAQEAGLSGLEFASGIPGTLGGGCAMNAGAYGGQLSDVLSCATVLLDGEVRTLSRDEMQMSYRSTLPLRAGGIVLAVIATLACLKTSVGLITSCSETFSAIFPKGPAYRVWAVIFSLASFLFANMGLNTIEGCGLKGARVGGAQVSEKHAGFIVNTGGATASDILGLIALVQRRVLAETGVALETEVRIVGED